MSDDDLQLELDGHVARIWLNRPSKRNSLTRGLFRRLDDALSEVDADPEIRAVVLRGRGHMFCSGFDLDEMAGTVLTGVHGWDGTEAGGKVIAKLHDLKKPTICVIEGFATAGGFELMLACDFAIAADESRIGDLHIRRALHGGAGPIYRLPRMLGLRRAKELVLTGKLLSGTIAAQWGLVNESVPGDQIDEAVERWLASLIDKSPLQMQISKMTINQGLDASVEALVTLERLAFALTMQSDDAKEGVAAFLEKRDPIWTGR